MFVKSTTKRSGLYNAAILIVILFVVIMIALAMVKIKKDPKDPEAMRNTLPFGKKKIG